MTTITDEMVEAALAAWHGVPVGYLTVLASEVERSKMRAALEAAERAAWRPIEEAPEGVRAQWRYKPSPGHAAVYAEGTRYDDQVYTWGGTIGLDQFDIFRPLIHPPEGDGK